MVSRWFDRMQNLSKSKEYDMVLEATNSCFGNEGRLVNAVALYNLPDFDRGQSGALFAARLSGII